MRLEMHLGDEIDQKWAQTAVTNYHYLQRPVDNRARPMTYVVTDNGHRVGLVMVGIPHATKCRGWWGYEGLPTQWQVVDMCRIWLERRYQQGGTEARPHIVPGFTDRKGVFRPTVASWMIQEVLSRVGRDRVALWPPVYLDQPYHIRLVISYHDPQYHRGTIYKVSGATPMYTDEDGTAVPGSSGKYGWCWKLPEPMWAWRDIDILRPRTIRMAFA